MGQMMLFLKGSRNFSLQSQPSALAHREDTSLSSSLDIQTGLASRIDGVGKQLRKGAGLSSTPLSVASLPRKHDFFTL